MKLKIWSIFSLLFLSVWSFGRPDPARNMDWTRPHSLNLYQYTQNDPVSNFDPTGLEWYRMQAHDDEGNETGVEWQYFEDTPEMQQIQVTQDDEGNIVEQIATIKGEKALLTFDGSSLNWLKQDGSTESWAAVSGNLDSMGRTQPDKQWVVDVGPVPEGTYSINPYDVQEWDNLDWAQQNAGRFGLGQWPGRTDSWGTYRVPLQPSQVTDPVSGVTRTNFFLHGGAAPGSRGCIDLCAGDKTFFPQFLGNKIQMLRNKNLKMRLEIQYPKVGKPPVPTWKKP